MQTLNSYLNLATSVITIGVTTLSVNPAQAASWFRTVTAGNDTYSDTQPGNEDVNFGGEDFIRVGNFPTGTDDKNGEVPPENQEEQRGYLSWDLQSIIDDVNNSLGIPQGAQIRNVNARLILHQSINDPLNPNDANGPRLSPETARVVLDGLGVTGQWDESEGINPDNAPATINAPTLFPGQIDLGRNVYSGTQLNTFIEDILNSNFNGNGNDDEKVLSIALRPTSSFNFPDPDPDTNTQGGFYPIDSFWSQNQDNEALKPKLELEFDVWNEAYKVMGGPNVTVQSRFGDWNTWEWGQLTKSQNGSDTVRSETNWRWRNGEAVPFELSCNPNNNRLSLKVGNQSPINYINNTCEGMDGISMFAQARIPNTEMEIQLTGIGELGGDTVDITDRDVNALGVAGNSLESLKFYFTDQSNPVADNGGGLDFTNGANFIQGLVTMRWDGEDGFPQGADNANQIQFTALTKVDDPMAGSTPQGSNPQDNNQISSNNTTVPEPSSVVTLMLLGTTGLGLRLRKK